MAAGTLNLTRQGETKVRISDDEETCSITGLDTTATGQLIFTDHKNRKVKLFSLDGELISSLQLSEGPWGVAVVNKSTVALCMRFTSHIVILDLGPGGQLSERGTIPLDRRACGIKVYKESLILACWESVIMINIKGEVLWSTGSPSEQLFVWAWYLTIRSGFGPDTVVVADWEKDTMTVLEADSGKLVKICDVEGRRPEVMTVDNYGTVYVWYFRTREIGVWSGEMVERYRTTPGQFDFNPEMIFYSTRHQELIVGGNSDWIFHYKIPR